MGSCSNTLTLKPASKISQVRNCLTMIIMPPRYHLFRKSWTRGTQTLKVRMAHKQQPALAKVGEKGMALKWVCKYRISMQERKSVKRQFNSLRSPVVFVLFLWNILEILLNVLLLYNLHPSILEVFEDSSVRTEPVLHFSRRKWVNC